MSHGPIVGVVVPPELELLELALPELADDVEALEVELGVPELVVDAPPLEPELLELPLPCRTTVPVRVGLVLCGVTVSVLPDAQYEYCGPIDEVVMTLPAVVNVPLAEADSDNTPKPPVCWTVAEHAQPPPAALVQVIVAYPAAWRGPLTSSHVVVVPDIVRHEAGNMSCSLPDVVVLSEYVPSELAVHVPVT
jgi:hypothetical protein